MKCTQISKNPKRLQNISLAFGFTSALQESELNAQNVHAYSNASNDKELIMKNLLNSMLNPLLGKYYFYRNMSSVYIFKILGASNNDVYASVANIPLSAGAEHVIEKHRLMGLRPYYSSSFTLRNNIPLRDCEEITNLDIIKILEDQFPDHVEQSCFEHEENREVVLFNPFFT